LNCGKLHVYPNHVTFSVSKLSDFEEKIMHIHSYKNIVYKGLKD
jgi:hypothetical protein